MAKSIEEIEVLWKDAESDTKMDYLFQAVCHINLKIEDNKTVCVCRLSECSDALAIRVDGYNEQFVTKKQAKISGVVFLVTIIAFSIGAGILSFKEALSIIRP